MSPAKKKKTKKSPEKKAEKTEKTEKKAAATPKGPTYRIPADSPWASAWKICAAVGGGGLAASLFGLTSDPHRFAFSWLFAFMAFLAVGLGGLFFVLGQHLTGAGWGVSLRRTAEFLLSGLPVFAILFIPVAFNFDTLYPWWSHHGDGHHEEGHGDEHGDEHADAAALLGFGDGAARAQEPRDPWDMHPNDVEALNLEHVESDHGEGHHDDPEHALHAEILESKTWWLNKPFFVARAVICFVVWIGVFWFFFSNSTNQDKKKGLAITRRLELFAPVGTILFGLSLTGAALDWTMSLEPSWYSTIFGVQYFAVSCVIAHSVMILISIGLRRSGLLGSAVDVEHLHDIGKLMHGFIIFWAYISFSQFMLIWYAGIPEEATYYHLRWWGGGGFLQLTVVMIVAGFVIPFFMLMSRNAKRNLTVLSFGAAWIAVMHFVQCYWLYMPYAEQVGLVATSLRLHWLDISCVLAVGGLYFAVVFWNMTRYPLIPLGDPRVDRALHHEVV